VAKLLQAEPGRFGFSVSSTTRSPRAGEQVRSNLVSFHLYCVSICLVLALCFCCCVYSSYHTTHTTCFFGFPVSSTTRSPRAGEQVGRNIKRTVFFWGTSFITNNSSRLSWPSSCRRNRDASDSPCRPPRALRGRASRWINSCIFSQPYCVFLSFLCVCTYFLNISNIFFGFSVSSTTHSPRAGEQVRSKI